MKSFLRRTATLGLIGSTVLGSWLSSNLAALAIPTQEIVEKLAPVPVFTIADSQGAPLVASGQDNKRVAGVFISQQDAEKFVERLKKENPDLGGKVQVTPVSLAEIFELAEKNKTNKDGLNFAYVPMQNEVESAKKLLTASGQEYQGGVPLFVARGENGYLTIQRNNEQVIPFFFEKEQVQQVLDGFKKAKPELASKVSIEVVPLEAVIATLQQNDNEMLDKIMLWPSRESIEFLRQNSPQQPPQQPKK